MSDYTRKEREAITRAWSLLEHMAEREGYNGRLSEIFKYERRGRHSQPLTRAVLVQCAYDGYLRPEKPARELCGFSWGCQWVYCLGARISDSQRHNAKRAQHDKSYADSLQRWFAASEECIKAQSAGRKRRLEAIG